MLGTGVRLVVTTRYTGSCYGYGINRQEAAYTYIMTNWYIPPCTVRRQVAHRTAYGEMYQDVIIYNYI